MTKRRLPIGIQTFREIREENSYYVDKTTQLIFKNEDADADWFDWIRMCDCNGDGHVDIVVDDAARNLIWENDGTGTFRPR